MSHQNAGFDLKQQIADPAAQCISDPSRELIQIRAMLIEVLQAVVISVKCHGLPGWLDTYNDFNFSAPTRFLQKNRPLAILVA